MGNKASAKGNPASKRMSNPNNKNKRLKNLNKNDRVILVCRSGERSARAADVLAKAGFTQVYNVVEGFEGDYGKTGRRDVNGWKNAGLPWTYKLDKAKIAANH